jgi:hypothetical protein
MTTLSEHLRRLNSTTIDSAARNQAVADLLRDFPSFGDFSDHYSTPHIDPKNDRLARLQSLRPFCWQCIRQVGSWTVQHDGTILCRDCEIRGNQNMAPHEPRKYGIFSQIALAEVFRRSGDTLQAEIHEYKAWRGED